MPQPQLDPSPPPSHGALAVLRSLILCVWLSGITFNSASGAEGFGVYSVEAFVERGQYIANVPVTVEGRVAIIAGGEIRFRKCEVRFKPANASVKIPDRSKNLRVVGHVLRNTGGQSETIFSVKAVEVAPEDLQALANLVGSIRRTAPAEEWYKAARWGEARARFYDDVDLQKKAEEVYAKGFAIERKQVKDGNPEVLLELAQRVKERELPDSIRTSLVHEYCARLWEKLKKASVPPSRQDWETLATQLAEKLPNCKEPLGVVDGALKRNYLITPVPEYDKAVAATRLTLHRYLYIDVQEQIILPQLAADGANGFEIAALIDEKVPELHTRAETLRETVLAMQAAEVNKMSRSEVTELAKAYRERNNEKSAAQVLESWLFLKRRNLPPNDVEAGLDLANDYRTLLKQDEAADKLLIGLAQRHPGAAEVQTLLTGRGYRFFDKRWMTQAEYAARPERKREIALAEGRIEPGMTASEVRQAKGTPQSLARVLSTKQVTEVWTYKQADSTSIAVYLAKDRRTPGDSQVVRIVVLGAQP